MIKSYTSYVSEGWYVEEAKMAKENDIDDEDVVEDDNEGWVDAFAALSEVEQKEVGEAIRPVKLVLVKVSTAAYHMACLMANLTHAHSSHHSSSISLRSISFTRQCCFFQNGNNVVSSRSSLLRSCHTTFPHAGTQHTTC
jgi:hypothetical protein